MNLIIYYLLFFFFVEKIKEVTVPKCEEVDCPGVVKPDIIFFGEMLPDRFHDSIEQDFPKAEVLIIMGSSLKVQPFASLVDRYTVV